MSVLSNPPASSWGNTLRTIGFTAAVTFVASWLLIAYGFGWMSKGTAQRQAQQAVTAELGSDNRIEFNVRIRIRKFPRKKELDFYAG